MRDNSPHYEPQTDTPRRSRAQRELESRITDLENRRERADAAGQRELSDRLLSQILELTKEQTL